MGNTVHHVTLFGLQFDINPVAFTLPIGDGWAIYWYGILIAVGFLLALVYALRRAKPLGVDPDRMIDVVLVAAPVGILGARAYYILFSKGTSFAEFFDIHSGGLAIYGGVIASMLAAIVMCKLRKVNFFSMLDLASLGFLIGQCVGRWGNFFNQEAYGGYTNSDWWGMGSAKITAEMDPLNVVQGSHLVHPCFLYESIWCLLGFILLHFLSKHRKFKGEIFLAYVSFYGLGRFFIEGLRTDSLMLGNIRVSQLVAGAAFVAGGAALLYLLHKKKKGGVPAEYTPQFADAMDSLDDEADAEGVEELEAEDGVRSDEAAGNGGACCADAMDDVPLDGAAIMDTDALTEEIHGEGEVPAHLSTDDEAGGPDVYETDGEDFADGGDDAEGKQ